MPDGSQKSPSQHLMLSGGVSGNGSVSVAPTSVGTPGPGPAPSPWQQDGPQTYFDEGGATLPKSVPGGNKGEGSLNAQALYVNGVPVTVAGGENVVLIPGAGITMTPSPILNAGTIALTPSGVVAASYGGALAIPVIEVDTFGRVVSASTVAGGWMTAATAASMFVDVGGDTMTGLLQVGGAGVGSVRLNPGDPTHAGLISYHKADGVRVGYMGYSLTTLLIAADTGNYIDMAAPGSRWSFQNNTFTIFGPNGTTTGILQQTDTHLYLRPRVAASYLYLGGADVNSILISSAGIFPSTTLVGQCGNTTNRWGNLYSVVGDFTGKITGYSATAPPAGGTLGVGLMLGSTTNFGIMFGVGLPDKAAPRGTWYMRADATAATAFYTNIDGTAGGWVAGGGGGASIAAGTTPPVTPADNALWWNTDAITGGGTMYIYYNDGSTSQWVPAAPSVSGQSIPPGSIMDFAGDTSPAGWLLCQGQSVTVAAYPNLHAAIGYKYGGSGANFNVPDLGGRVVAGKEAVATRLSVAGGAGFDGAVVGAAGGKQAHVLLEAELTAHGHYMSHGHPGDGGAAVLYGNYGNAFGTTVAGGNYVGYATGVGSSSLATTNTVGSSSAHINVQPTMIMNKVIKT